MSAQVHREITRVAAYGLVVDGDRILLCRISDQLPRLAGQWTLPGGGLEFSEDPVDAMVREVREETGLIVRAAGLAGVESATVPTEHATYHAIRIIYHAEYLGGELIHEIDGSTDRCEWWPKSALQDIPMVDLVWTGVGYVWPETGNS